MDSLDIESSERKMLRHLFFFLLLLYTCSEPIKFIAMIIYVIKDGVVTIKEWVKNPNA